MYAEPKFWLHNGLVTSVHASLADPYRARLHYCGTVT